MVFVAIAMQRVGARSQQEVMAVLRAIGVSSVVMTLRPVAMETQLNYSEC